MTTVTLVLTKKQAEDLNNLLTIDFDSIGFDEDEIESFNEIGEELTKEMDKC